MIFDWFERWALYSPDKIAFKEFESQRTLTYQQINFLANATARWLKNDFGLQKGDRIAVLAENCLEYVVLFAVTQKTGFILVPLNYRLSPRELTFMLDDSNPELLFCQDNFRTKIENPEAQPIKIMTLALSDLTYKMEEFINADAEEIPQRADFNEDHPIFIIYTSGTTAFPKGAVYSHKMLFWNSINTELRLDITSTDRAVNCTPPFHTGSWNVLQNPFVHHGAYTLLMKSFDPNVVLEQLEKDKHTVFWGIPTMLKMMEDSPKFKEVNLSHIRYFVIGGEAMPIPLIEKYHQKGISIRQGYGLTEVGPNVFSLDQTEAIRKQGSIGTPNFYYDVMLVDEQGNQVPDGEPGELIIKGPAVTPGYWNNPEANKNTIVDGWLHTGDLMKKDNEGFFYVVDRIKNMYISGGENVYPAEVEHLIRTLPEVKDVAIIGVPDKKWGETGKAFVVFHEKKSLTIEEITAFCQKNLAKFKIPKYFDFIPELPVNNAGKIDRKKLRHS